MKTIACLALLALAPAALLGESEEARKGPRVATILMFEGRAEEAMDVYVSLLPGSKVLEVERYGPGDESGDEGSVKLARFSLAGQEFLCFDSKLDHPFTFTASMSIFVECESEAQLDALYAKLSEGGEAFMPLADYGFSRKFGWVGDRFGVSWQMNLP
jgi:predicted 3-demethylubiquinone-9 3-methyltransferase (glyoxalase superfamily)